MKFSDNGLIAALSPTDQARLLKRCNAVQLQAGERLSVPEAGQQQVYFLTSASVALVARNGERPGLALSLTGREGAVGLQFALGMGPGNLSLLVQTSGAAWVVDGLELQTLIDRRAKMLLTFSRYLWSVAHEIATHAAFAQLQDIRSRVAGWILLSEHRCGQQELYLTHSHLAEMLGVRRTSVTLAAMELKQLGLVDYQRGRVRILDRSGLEALSCWSAEPAVGPEPIGRHDR